MQMHVLRLRREKPAAFIHLIGCQVVEPTLGKEAEFDGVQFNAPIITISRKDFHRGGDVEDIIYFMNPCGCV